jgi:hypothetical protein
VKRLTLLALLLASSSLVGAPSPMPKAQRKVERPAVRPSVVHVPDVDPHMIVNWRVIPQPAAVFKVPAQEAAQPPNADPPG